MSLKLQLSDFSPNTLSFANPIPILGYSFSTERESSDESVVRQTSLGLGINNEIAIYKAIDQSSSFFFHHALIAHVIPGIIISYENSNDSTTIQYEIKNAMVSEYQSFIISDDLPIESISLNYTHITMRYIDSRDRHPQPYSCQLSLGCVPKARDQLVRQAAKRTNEGFELFVATVYGEACGQSEVAWQAVASVIINRINHPRFVYKKHCHYCRFHNSDEVIKISGFDAYQQKTVFFKKALNYLRDKSIKKDSLIEKMMELLKPIFYENQITTDAQLYYSPRLQAFLHKVHPKKYHEIPNWNYFELKEIKVFGLKSTDDFKFFKYK